MTLFQLFLLSIIILITVKLLWRPVLYLLILLTTAILGLCIHIAERKRDK
ncbi:gp52 [Listeria phage P40]|nr:gp52 [Listeria phage P40]ACI00412.1 gp52 [Listeria phage P40]